MNIINIYENYNSYFNDDLKAIFELCSKIAAENNYKIFLIGGLVRDLLLTEKSLDIDITVEGDAIEFAKVLEKKADAKISSIHKDFGTVKVELLGQKIDFASTRNEIYPEKGQLPVVEKIGCSLKEDVLRRDFTINSLALSLNQDNFADLNDFVGGFEDLKSKKIKILHENSFIDDPTRIIRGLKYSTRLGFELDEKTLECQKKYLNNINYSTGIKRIKQELKKTFNANSQKALELFINQGIYKLITQNQIKKPSTNIEQLIREYKPKHPWIVYLGLFIINEDLDKFNLTKNEKNIIENAKNLINTNFEDDFKIYKAFHSIEMETLLILHILGKEKEVTRYLKYLKEIKLTASGKDLVKLGFKPSKSFGKALDKALKEKLKNPNMTKSQEVELLTTILKK